ncbi:MAG: ABC transporter permease [Anaerolineae bacterium]|nr:ABC transporter permease [Anaerolineae bacterium]
MTTTTLETPKRRYGGYTFTRKRTLALFLLILAAFMLFGGQNIAPAATTTLTLQAGNIDTVSKIVVPTLPYVTIMGLFFVATAALALLPQPGLARLSTALMIVAGVVVIPTMVIVAAAGSATNIMTLLTESLQLATPIAIGAMAGIWCERSGVVNIAIEGMMLFSACFGFTVLFYLRDAVPPDQIGQVQLIALAVAVLCGGLVAVLHAWLSITFATDQIVSGTVINILALGVTSFIRREYLLSTEGGFPTFSNVYVPILRDIPILGEAFFTGNKPIFYLMFLIIIGTHVILFYTRLGLRIRAVGEHPSAADTLGINVNRVRWLSVFVGGMIAGLAGAWFSLEATGRFNDNMTNGAGFIALAAMIFGKWTPFGAFAGAILFGFASALGTRFQILNVGVPVQFLQMVPYIVTLVVLAGLVGRAFPPKAVGTPYKKE